MIGILGGIAVKVVADVFDEHGEAVNGLSSVGCEACCMKREGLCNSDFSQADEAELFGADCIGGNWHYEKA